MSIELTEEQRQAFLKGEPVRVSSPDLGQDAVLVRAELFAQLEEDLRAEREQAAFRKFAMKQAARLAKENPY